MSSPVRHRENRKTANRPSRRTSSAHTQKSRNVIANVTGGWPRPRSCRSRDRRDMRKRQQPGSTIGLEMSPSEPKHRQRTKCHDDHLGGVPGRGRRPDDPDRREQHQERIDVPGETRYLLARLVNRRLEWPSVNRAPDCLRHVPEVEASKAVARIGIADHPEEHERPQGLSRTRADLPGARLAISRTRDEPLASSRTRTSTLIAPPARTRGPRSTS